MKIKNKVSNANWILVLILSFFEIVYIHYVIGQNLDLFFSSNPAHYLKLDIVSLCFNIVYVLYIVDFGSKIHNVVNIFKSYKKDINYKFKNTYLYIQIIKALGLCYIEPSLSLNFVILEISLFLVFKVVVFINKPKDNKEYKIKKFKRELKKKNLKIGVILFDESQTNDKFFVSTFDPYHTIETKISDDYIYIDFKNDIPKILKACNRKSKESKESILQKIYANTVVFLKRAKTCEVDEIYKFRKYCLDNNLELKNNFTILAFDNNEIKVPEDLEYLASFKTCITEKYIEVIEDLLSKEKKFDFEKKSRIKGKIIMGLKKYFLKEENIFKSNEERDAYIKKELYIKCKEMYNNRFIGIKKTMSKDRELFYMYKNAFMQESIHQSYMILLNYTNMLHQMVSYYLYAKNNKNFNLNIINFDIIYDNYTNYYNVIKENLKENDAIYDNLNNEKEYKISKDFEDLIYVYLSNLLSMNIEGKTLTYSGAVYLTKIIRDKIKAHGTISDEDSYLFWAVCYYLTEFFNNVFKVESLESISSRDFVAIKYKGDKNYTKMGEYIKVNEDGVRLIVQGSKNKVTDISYLSGKFVRPVTKIHRN